MKILINCSWASPSERQVENDTIVVSKEDMSADFIVDGSDCPFSSLASRFPAHKRCFMSAEPSIFSNYNDDLVRRYDDFYKGSILTWHKQLKHLPQYKPFKYGTSWTQWDTKPEDKKFGIGGIFSAKADSRMHGYELRRKIIDNQWNINIPSMVFNPSKSWHGHRFEYPKTDKRESLEWMYHFAIENCSEEGYFTEKIMDCLMTHSIPVYFGDPVISDVFVADGIIRLDEDNIANQVNQLTPELYKSKIEAVVENKRRASMFIDVFLNVLTTLKGEQPRMAGYEVTKDWKINGKNT